MSPHTVVTALDLALAEPPNLGPLHRITTSFAPSPDRARRAIVAGILEAGLAPLSERGGSAASQHTLDSFRALVSEWCSPNDLILIYDEPVLNPDVPRSPEWTAAAHRLAAWADAQMESSDP